MPARADCVRTVLTIYSLATFALLWTLFGVALLVNRGWLDQLWEWLRGLPSIVDANLSDQIMTRAEGNRRDSRLLQGTEERARTMRLMRRYTRKPSVRVGLAYR